MQRRITIAVALVLILLAIIWQRLACASQSPPSLTTTMRISGTPGASFTGYYLTGGKRVEVSGVVPWSLSMSNVTRIEIRKANPNDEFRVEMEGGGSSMSASTGPGTVGVRMNLEGGGNFKILRGSE
jgi:hypothetical protein